MDGRGCPTKIGVEYQMRDESMGFKNVGVPVQQAMHLPLFAPMENDISGIQ
jgi:hypothetical protein